MKLSLIIFLALCSEVFGFDRVKLYTTPAPQSNFLSEQWTGKWYFQYRLASCFWQGSYAFIDWTQIISKDEKSLTTRESWQSFGECGSLFARFFQCQPNKGCFKAKDTLGGVMSGDMIIPATDYTSFFISWTCIKPYVDEGVCSDVAVEVKTRKINPSSTVVNTIEAILKKQFGLSLSDMTKYRHTGACPQRFYPVPMNRRKFATY